MRYLIVSDVHANIEALDAVLEEVRHMSFDSVLCLGDIVGYGASPNEVVERLRALPVDVWLRGNHDKVAAGIEDGENFNSVAKEAALWTREQLSEENLDFIRGLRKGPLVVDYSFTIAHGTPEDEDAYVTAGIDALRAFRHFRTSVCFHGHSHVVGTFMSENGMLEYEYSPEDDWILTLHPNGKYLINPGSVGQPRARHPRASFALYDHEIRTVRFRRVTYDFETTQRRILEAGLPLALAQRLTLGM